MHRLDQLRQTRLVDHVASDMAVLCSALVTDRSALATFIDSELSEIPGDGVAGRPRSVNSRGQHIR
jgi:hypothetical protein